MKIFFMLGTLIFSTQVWAMGTVTTCTDISGHIEVNSWNGMVEKVSLDFSDKEIEDLINRTDYVYVETEDHKIIWSKSTESGQYDREFSTVSNMRLVKYQNFNDQRERKNGKILFQLGELSCLSLTNNHE